MFSFHIQEPEVEKLETKIGEGQVELVIQQVSVDFQKNVSACVCVVAFLVQQVKMCVRNSLEHRVVAIIIT